MYRYENAVRSLQLAGLYSATVAIALRAEYRRQCINAANRGINEMDNAACESPNDITEKCQHGK